MEEMILARSMYIWCILYNFTTVSFLFCSISCISICLNAYDYYYNHLPHSRPAGSTIGIPASANVAYELSKFSSQLKEAIYILGMRMRM